MGITQKSPQGDITQKSRFEAQFAEREAQMAESVDALASNTSGAIRAGSTPALGTEKTLNREPFFLCLPSPVSSAITAKLFNQNLQNVQDVLKKENFLHFFAEKFANIIFFL